MGTSLRVSISVATATVSESHVVAAAEIDYILLTVGSVTLDATIRLKQLADSQSFADSGYAVLATYCDPDYCGVDYAGTTTNF